MSFYERKSEGNQRYNFDISGKFLALGNSVNPPYPKLIFL